MAVQPSSGSTGAQVPELVTNPLASVQAAPCLIQVSSRVVEVPAMSAAQWLELLMGELDLELIFPDLLNEDDQDLVNDLLISGEFTVIELQRRALQIITEVSGRPWWIALRMIQVAQERWALLGGTLIRKRVNPTQIPLGAWLDALWLTMLENMPQEKWALLTGLIEAPPPEEMPESPLETMEMDADSFTQLMNG